jgi:hypothetical protein
VTAWYGRLTEDILVNPKFSRRATESEVVEAYLRSTRFLGNAYTFVRLLEASRKIPRVRGAIARLDQIFDAALADQWTNLSFGEFEAFGCTTLGRVQLEAGLIALNSILGER